MQKRKERTKNQQVPSEDFRDHGTLFYFRSLTSSIMKSIDKSVC